MPANAYLAIGSNLGNRESLLARALELLRAEPGLNVRAVSRWYETAPVGGPEGSGAYLNGAIQVTCTHSPEELLALCLEIERRLGRVRSERNAPRTLDLDVLLYDSIVRTVDPLLPHPRMHERAFVLVPLNELAADVIHPTSGKTIRQLLASLPANDPTPPVLYSGTPRQVTQLLAGQRALITGSTSGIGLAIATEFAWAGARVILHGRKPRKEAISRLNHWPAELPFEYVPANLNALEEQDRLAHAAWDIHNGLDILINNAGADTLTGPAAKWSFERKLQELLAVDLTGTIRLSRLIGKRMKEANGGAILTIGWDQSELGMEGDSGTLFAAVKGAIHAATKSLAKDLAPAVRVNGIAPGWIRTSWGEQASDTWQERVRRESQLGRWGLPEDIARLAKFLVCAEASYIQGQMIAVNGGWA